jgi:hypothetical protein
MTSLTTHLEHYLVVRHNLGYDQSFQERVLRKFTGFAEAEGENHITIELFLRWKEHFGSANNYTWSKRLMIVRVFATWLKSIDPRNEVPPPGLISDHTSTLTNRLQKLSLKHVDFLHLMDFVD